MSLFFFRDIRVILIKFFSNYCEFPNKEVTEFLDERFFRYIIREYHLREMLLVEVTCIAIYKYILTQAH